MGLGVGLLVVVLAALWQAFGLGDTLWLLLLSFLGSAAWLGVALLGLSLPLTRASCLRALAFLLPFIPAVAAALPASRAARPIAFARLARRSQPLVEAICEYSAEQGRPPESLQALVPQYLERVPGTGLPAYPQYDYEILSYNKWSTHLIWYDLGSREGRGRIDPWSSIDGDLDHAILALWVKGEYVLHMNADRMPVAVAWKPFDPESWARGGPARTSMTQDVVHRLQWDAPPTLDAAVELLGPPDGERWLGTTPWELWVSCGAFPFINFDVFVYWPTEEYPDYMHGGWVERIGRWAYVHE